MSLIASYKKSDNRKREIQRLLIEEKINRTEELIDEKGGITQDDISTDEDIDEDDPESVRLMERLNLIRLKGLNKRKAEIRDERENKDITSASRDQRLGDGNEVDNELSTSEKRIDVESKGQKNIFTKLKLYTCFDQPCSMKDCSYRSYLGVNVENLPQVAKELVPILGEYMKKKCCCFCIGHLIFFVGLVATKKVVKDTEDKVGASEINTAQKIVDGINEKGVGKAFVQRLQMEVFKYSTIFATRRIPRYIMNLISVLIPKQIREEVLGEGEE